MPLQGIDFFGNLPFSPLDPSGTDSRTISDDQHRNIIASLNRQAPNWTGAITATHADLNTLNGLAAAGTKPMPGVGNQTVLYFYNINTPPPGWSLFQPDGAVRQLVIGSESEGGTIGGNKDPLSGTYSLSVSLNSTSISVTGGSTGSESGHTHPGFAHNHWWYIHNPGLNASHGSFDENGITVRTFTEEDNGTGIAFDTDGNKKLTRNYYTRDAGGEAFTGSGSAHSHGAGSLSGSVNNGTSTGSFQVSPRYASGIFGRLDA